MTTPYETWNQICKTAWNSCVQAYMYDTQIIARHNALENYLKYRSTDLLRHNFTVEDEFVYESELSTDTVCVFTCMKGKDLAVCIGYRGTDPVDPMRFLNFIPKDYDKNLAKNFTEMTNLKFKDWNDIVKNPYTNYEEAKKCQSGVSLSARERVLEKTTAEYASLNATALFTDKRGIESFQRKEKNDLQWMYLQGGTRAAPLSDFIADVNIGSARLGPRNLAVIDEKHKAAILHTEKIVATIKERQSESLLVILAGHSLGGSLALGSFLHCKATYGKDIRFRYVGFNAATLVNFDEVIDSMPKHIFRMGHTLQIRDAVHFRNEGDLVSVGAGAGLGKWIPTITYESNDAKKSWISYIKESDTALNIHGIWSFFTCRRAVKKSQTPSYDLVSKKSLMAYSHSFE
jgi:hypothetical protein